MSWTAQERAELARRVRTGMMLCGWPDPVSSGSTRFGTYAVRWSIGGKTVMATVGDQAISIVVLGRYRVCPTAISAIRVLQDGVVNGETHGRTMIDVDD